MPSPYLTRDSSLAASRSYELKLVIGALQPNRECCNSVQTGIRIAWNRCASHLEYAYGMHACHGIYQRVAFPNGYALTEGACSGYAGYCLRSALHSWKAE